MKAKNHANLNVGEKRPSWFTFAFRALLFLLLFSFSSLGLARPSPAEERDPWQYVPADVKKPMLEVSERASNLVNSQHTGIRYSKGGGVDTFSLALYGWAVRESLALSWYLPGVEKSGEPWDPSSKKHRRTHEFGGSFFRLLLQDIKGMTSNEAVDKIEEARRLQETRNSLEMEAFWLLYNVVVKESKKAKEAGEKEAQQLRKRADKVRADAEEQAKTLKERADALYKQAKRISDEARTLMRSGRSATSKLGDAARQRLREQAWAKSREANRVSDRATALVKRGKELRSDASKRETELRNQAYEEKKAGEKAALRKLEAETKAKLKEIIPKLEKAREEEQAYRKAGELAALEVEEANVRERYQKRFESYQESIKKYRSRAESETDPKQKQTLEKSVQLRLNQIKSLNQRKENELKQIRDRRAWLEGKPGARGKPKPQQGKKRPKTALEKLLEPTTEKTSSFLYRANSALGSLRGPVKAWSQTFSTPGGEGLILEGRFLASSRRSRRMAAHWTCGRYLVSLSTTIENPILEWARIEKSYRLKYDGKHKWVPFLGDRLKQ
ncbi:MAG: hypothetical protein ACE5JS_06655, partial [Nitrospinota bacterium]